MWAPSLKAGLFPRSQEVLQTCGVTRTPRPAIGVQRYLQNVGQLSFRGWSSRPLAVWAMDTAMDITSSLRSLALLETGGVRQDIDLPCVS